MLLLQSMLLFLPILAANQAGFVSIVAHVPGWNIPVSVRYLGENKTLSVYYVGPLLAAVVVMVGYGAPQDWWRGAGLGLGAVLGDHIKSFIKRRLGYPPGSKWWLDRIDFAIGGGLAAKLLYPGVTWWHVAIIVTTAWPVHYFGNKWSYRHGWRKTPH